jgi:hypothetical protein
MPRQKITEQDREDRTGQDYRAQELEDIHWFAMISDEDGNGAENGVYPRDGRKLLRKWGWNEAQSAWWKAVKYICLSEESTEGRT